MTVCKQLNYLSRKSILYCSKISEELIADGEIYGRNWSLLECVWNKDVEYYCGKYHYILRIDISEYQEGYRKITHGLGSGSEKLDSMLIVNPRGCGMLRFAVHNQSPGIWENGFNPNYWLETEIGSYVDEAERLRKIVESGRDMKDMHDIGLVVQSVFDEIGPALKMLEAAAPRGVPYCYWWGNETPPPPRKPVY